jgi:hypothetical protein
MSAELRVHGDVVIGHDHLDHSDAQSGTAARTFFEAKAGPSGPRGRPAGNVEFRSIARASACDVGITHAYAGAQYLFEPFWRPHPRIDFKAGAGGAFVAAFCRIAPFRSQASQCMANDQIDFDNRWRFFPRRGMKTDLRTLSTAIGRIYDADIPDRWQWTVDLQESGGNALAG